MASEGKWWWVMTGDGKWYWVKCSEKMTKGNNGWSQVVTEHHVGSPVIMDEWKTRPHFCPENPFIQRGVIGVVESGYLLMNPRSTADEGQTTVNKKVTRHGKVDECLWEEQKWIWWESNSILGFLLTLSVPANQETMHHPGPCTITSQSRHITSSLYISIVFVLRPTSDSL